MSTRSFKTFADLAQAVSAERTAASAAVHARDIDAARRLARSRKIANRKPGTGPRVAR